MLRNEIANKIFVLWCDVLEITQDINNISEKEFMEIIGSQLDSIDIIKLLVSIEDEFNIEFDDDVLTIDSEQLFTVVVAYVEDKSIAG